MACDIKIRLLTKRIFDLVFAAALLLVFLPFGLLAAAAESLFNLNMFQLFSQTRIGKNQVPFVVYKLKTMNDNTDASGRLLSDAERLTGFGKFLRKTSLDELPQLWNVIKGDMSFVGPRPLLPQYLPLYSQEQLRRHEVRPGITGWAQVNGRNTISWKDKFELDLFYIDNHSILLDFKILWMTIANVLMRKGISAEGAATARAFDGTN